jgi:hypothetical protein
MPSVLHQSTSFVSLIFHFNLMNFIIHFVINYSKKKKSVLKRFSLLPTPHSLLCRQDSSNRYWLTTRNCLKSSVITSLPAEIITVEVLRLDPSLLCTEQLSMSKYISRWVNYTIHFFKFHPLYIISNINRRYYIYGGANVIISDLTNVQGVIHIIDAVILTDSQLPSINKKY